MVSKVGEGAHQSRDERNIKKRRKMVLGKIQFSSFQHESSEIEQITTSESNLMIEIFPPQVIKRWLS